MVSRTLYLSKYINRSMKPVITEGAETVEGDPSGQALTWKVKNIMVVAGGWSNIGDNSVFCILLVSWEFSWNLR